MDIWPPVINPNDISPFSITLISLEPSVINVSKPQSDCWDLCFGRDNPDDYCAVARTASFHSLLPVQRPQLVESFHYHNEKALLRFLSNFPFPKINVALFVLWLYLKKRTLEKKDVLFHQNTRSLSDNNNLPCCCFFIFFFWASLITVLFVVYVFLV